MPATSQKQQRAMAIAEHHPEELHEKNRGLLKMSPAQLHEFASTPRHGLPMRATGRARDALKRRLHAR